MKYFLLILSLLHGQINTQTLFISNRFSSRIEARNSFQKEKPTILWDLHKVLFLQNPSSFIKKSLFSKKNIFTCPIQTLRAVGSKKNWNKLIVELNSGTITYDAYCKIFKKYPDLYDILIKLGNNLFTPNKPVLSIVHTLFDKKYDNYLFSNIGPIVLKDLKNRYPLAFAYFKDHGKNLINSIVPNNGKWIAKPQPETYITAMNYIQKNPSNIIFIDDNKDNINAALHHGWTCILYKNPEQLAHDLEQILT